MKTISPHMRSEFHSLRVLTLIPDSDKDGARWLNTMLSAIDIANVKNVRAMSMVPALLREGDIDLIVADVAHGGLMLPSLLKTLDAATPMPRFPRILWVGQPPPVNLLPAPWPALAEQPAVRRVGGLPVTALLAHARLAHRAGINVGMVYGGGKAVFTEALRDLLLAPSNNRHASCSAPADAPTEVDVIEALTTGKNLRVMLQPQFDLRTRRIIGAEALLRWRLPGVGEVPPSVLIPMVNRLGLHLLLFSFIETRVIDVLLVLKSRQVALPIALNASAETVCTPGLAQRLAEKMQRAGLPPQLLKIELTGDLPVADELLLSASLNTLRKRGFPVSLDDFGQGTSTLNLLAKMSFDEVKIDGAFVRDMKTSASAQAVIAATVSLARLMNLKVVAEGIEEASCIEALACLGCPTGQGYALARPMELRDFFDSVSNK
ncbi:EAL domain-containing protein [Janthinobacterium sp. EB271-G4-7A]|uniref:EAL domain-containing protein n=1 Tax=Janthinobacterium sp. EB271-G4-7A TaxID=2775056 RepID=UPI001E600AB4|nr:EAL domain-containing protein [Janthinobacterium sp. EB271-G4-7A]MCC7697806.1 EAL domain-containing protein [Janthinobacterium sp. EB271-G4-7A]